MKLTDHEIKQVRTLLDNCQFSGELTELMNDWSRFTTTCHTKDCSVKEYIDDLRPRVIIQAVIEGVDADLAERLKKAVHVVDHRYLRNTMPVVKSIIHEAECVTDVDVMLTMRIPRTVRGQMKDDLIEEGVL